jgi:LysM repeat protein
MVAMALGAALAVNVVSSKAPGSPERTASRIYVVRSGDTIWRIARREAGAHEDPRPLVDRLIRANRLRGAVIRPGQQLVLPS